jgi:MFS family permease
MIRREGEANRSRATRALYASEFASTLGTQMSALAIAWAVLTETGSSGQMGLVMAAEMAPVGLAALAGGPIAAAIGARRLVLICDGGRVPILAAVALALSRLDESFVPLLALVALAGLAISPYLAAQRILLTEIGGEEVDAVRRSSAGLQVSTRSAVLIGPLLAGALIPFVGPVTVVAIDAATYLLSFLAVAAFVPRGVGGPVGAAAKAERAWPYLRHDPVVRGLLSASAGAEFAFQALAAVLPVMALTTYDAGAGTAGLLIASWGLGALGGNLSIALLKRVRAPLTVSAWAALLTAFGFLAIAALPPLPITLALLVLVGISTGVRGPLVLTHSILRVPSPLRPQVTTLYFSLLLCSAPIALLVAGPAIQWLNVQVVVGAAAAILFACAASFGRIASSVTPRPEQREARDPDGKRPRTARTRLQLRRP